MLLRFVNAEGYYLYRHRFQFKVEPAQVSLGQVQLPAGKQHHDEYFGDTGVYYNIVDLEIPLNNPARQPYTLVVTYQGCADRASATPETRRFDIDGGAAPPAASDAAGKGPLEHKGKRSLLFFFLAGLTLTFTPACCRCCRSSPEWSCAAGRAVVAASSCRSPTCCRWRSASPCSAR